MVGDLLRTLGYGIAGYADRDPFKLGRVVEHVGSLIQYAQEEILHSIEATGRYPDGVDASALGIGDNREREFCLRRLKALEVPPLVHPSATVSGSAHIGKGAVVFPNAVVNAGARIGEGVIVNSGAVVEHDCDIGMAAHVSPGAVLCGGVRVGSRSWVGAGATIIHGVAVGEDVIVGAGSTVLHDVADEARVVGSPAQPITQSRVTEKPWDTNR